MKNRKPSELQCPAFVSSPPCSKSNEDLPNLETIFYSIAAAGSIFYNFYEVFKASNELSSILNAEEFSEGWALLGRKKDISNYEWTFWSRYFWNILPWGVGHIVIASVVNIYFVKYRKSIFLAYSLVSVTALLGYRTVLLFITHSAVCFLASSFGSFKIVWCVSLLLLSTLNNEIFTLWITNFCFHGTSDEERFYFIVFVLALVILRYTSFCLERSRHVKTKGDNSSNDGYSSVDLLLYIFYLPLFFTGPLITYDKFKVQFNSAPRPWTRARFLLSLCNILRVMFWAVFMEVSHHLIYYNSLLHNVITMERISLWGLMALGYLQGQYFMIKYVVLYGLPAQVAILDDLHPPSEPKCISYIYRYSDMWKYFDRGLYDFLRNYIYIPMGGSQGGMSRRLAASLLCFLYIYMWHGQEYYLLLWSLANYMGCSLELMATRIENTALVSRIKMKMISPAMMRRLKCVLYTPLFIMSVFAIFYFFAGINVGEIFIRRLVTHASMETHLLLFFVIYVNIQNAVTVNNWLSRKIKTG